MKRLKLHLSFLSIAIINGLFLFYLINNPGIIILQGSADFNERSEESPGLSYNLNLPFHAGSLLPEKVQQIIINQITHHRRLSLRFAFFSSDDIVIQLIHRYTAEVFHNLQVRSATEFICELQI
ncbi:MAG: hypothetical protein JW830_15725 [Bacteroidales bacterium]|nr:hypothetical protein [Bacteroidales bacterium]